LIDLAEMTRLVTHLTKALEDLAETLEDLTETAETREISSMADPYQEHLADG